MKGFRQRFAMSACSAALLVSALPALAQTGNGYEIGEGAQVGPVRMARVSDLVGTAELRPSSSVSWGVAAMNTPLRQGAEIWAKNGSRTEFQFDDGTVCRLGGDGVAVLETMYSDSNGEFTELKLENGLMTLHLKSKLSEYQVDTPQCSVKAYGPAIVRVGVNGSTAEAVVENGQAQIDGSGGSRTLVAGQRVDLGSSGNSSQVAAAFAVRTAPAHDNWDRWSSERDTVIYHQNRYLPSDVNLTAGDLDAYGSWHDDPKYGEVWAPSESADWQPYEEGSWDWVSPFGWTWCGDEPWGWAPYHYGSWYRASWGWSWCPGPAAQYWSPAVVDFCGDGADVAWAPLAPWECRYPAGISIGFASGDWALSFSIGQVACWYPAGADYCEARPWANVFVNTGWGNYDPGYINNYYASTVSYSGWGASRFHPYNAFHENGAVFASRGTFANGGRFAPMPRTRSAGFFTNGRSFTGAPRGSQISGPLGIRPSRNAFTPSHRSVQSGPPANIASRSVYRSRLASNIARQSVSNRGMVATNTRVGNNRVAANAAMNRENQNRVATRANGTANGNNRYARFNNVSHSPFTNSQRTVTRNALHNGVNRVANTRSNATNRVANARNTGSNRVANMWNNAVNRGRNVAANHVSNGRGVARRTNAVNNTRRATMGRTSNRANRSMNRSSFTRPNRTANTRSFNRPSRTISRPSFSRPSRTFSRPSFSRPSSNRSSFSRPSFSRSSSSRPSFSRPSFSRSSGSRPSTPRGGGGGGRQSSPRRKP